MHFLLILVFLLFLNNVSAQELITDKNYLHAREYKSLKDALENPLKVYRLNLKRYNQSVIPPEIGKLKNLVKLEINSNQLRNLPPELSKLKKLQYLDLTYSRYMDMNRAAEIYSKCHKLTYLILADNQIRQLPVHISRLKNLKYIDLSFNKGINLKQSISVLSKAGNIRVLILTDNNLSDIPGNITDLKNLKELHLEYNPLSEEVKNKLRELLPEVRIIF